MTILSPLTGSSDITLMHQLSTEQILHQYQCDFGIDVKKYFHGLTTIDVYRCNLSGIGFYYPYALAGDGEFYANLAKTYKGYYSIWKWEHEKTIKYVKEGGKILEIGCGNGFFLKKVQEKKALGWGLDFNKEAVAYGKRYGIKIMDEDITSHSIKQSGKYDMVCAFQLLEHVNDVGNFIEDSLKCLKTGGVFAIGVPNNDSLVFKWDSYNTLNLPPHHMLLWNVDSLKSLAKQFNLTIVEIVVQPANKISRSVVYRLWLEKKIGKSKISKLVHVVSRWLVKRLPVFNEGVTVVAIFRK